MTRVLVLGESLIDIVRDPYGEEQEHVGGSPLNVAVGLSALGHAVDFATTYGPDGHGERIHGFVTDAGVRLVDGSQTPQPTSTALAELDEAGAATYTFDLHWELPEVTAAENVGHAHTGSIGAMLSPGAARVLSAIDAVRGSCTVSYDPNVRPTIMGPAEEVRPRVEAIISRCDVVKASSDDTDFLYPGDSAAAVLQRWVDLGARFAIITLGAHGVTYRTAATDEVGALPTAATHVVDTVGAGDSFMAGVLSGLLDLGLLGGSDERGRLAEATVEDVRPAVDRGLATSGVTVGHTGAYAPTRAEL